MTSFEDRIVFSGRRNSDRNNRLFSFSPSQETIDVDNYPCNTILQDNTGKLYAGDSLTNNIFQLYDGYDDDGFEIKNYWIGNADDFDTNNLKKTKRLRIKGFITPGRTLKISRGLDGSSHGLIGTVLGDGTYVDRNSSNLVGENKVGTTEVGGGGEGIVGNYFFHEIKVPRSKYLHRSIKLEGTGYGILQVRFIEDHDIRYYQSRMPKKYRVRDNVSLDGTQTNLDNPE
jgi:hypothetical protein